MDTLVTGETRSFWVGLESRLAECERCPPEGAACEPRVDRLDPGVQVRLRVDGGQASSSLKRCPRYLDWKLSRRLESMGVDPRLSRMKLSDLGQVKAEVLECFALFVSGGSGRAPKGIEVLIEGAEASSYAAVLLRNALKYFPSASYRSVHVPSLIRQAKNAMTTKQESPFQELIGVDVLSIDAVDAESLRNKYFFPELKWVYERRHALGLTTIITSAIRVGEAFPGASVLRV